MEPAEAEISSDWYKWRITSPVEAQTLSLVHALGLQRDPARSRTHIVFKQVEYVPKTKDARNRFKVIAAGVFKLDDVWAHLDAIMGLEKDESKIYVKEILEEFDNSVGKKPEMPVLPMLDIMLSNTKGIKTDMGIREFSFYFAMGQADRH